MQSTPGLGLEGRKHSLILLQSPQVEISGLVP